jgi:hypothetical protein
MTAPSDHGRPTTTAERRSRDTTVHRRLQPWPVPAPGHGRGHGVAILAVTGIGAWRLRTVSRRSRLPGHCGCPPVKSLPVGCTDLARRQSPALFHAPRRRGTTVATVDDYDNVLLGSCQADPRRRCMRIRHGLAQCQPTGRHQRLGRHVPSGRSQHGSAQRQRGPAAGIASRPERGSRRHRRSQAARNAAVDVVGGSRACTILMAHRRLGRDRRRHRHLTRPAGFRTHDLPWPRFSDHRAVAQRSGRLPVDSTTNQPYIYRSRWTTIAA